MYWGWLINLPWYVSPYSNILKFHDLLNASNKKLLTHFMHKLSKNHIMKISKMRDWTYYLAMTISLLSVRNLQQSLMMKTTPLICPIRRFLKYRFVLVVDEGMQHEANLSLVCLYLSIDRTRDCWAGWTRMSPPLPPLTLYYRDQSELTSSTTQSW